MRAYHETGVDLTKMARISTQHLQHNGDRRLKAGIIGMEEDQPKKSYRGEKPAVRSTFHRGLWLVLSPANSAGIQTLLPTQFHHRTEKKSFSRALWNLWRVNASPAQEGTRHVARGTRAVTAPARRRTGPDQVPPSELAPRATRPLG